MPNTDDSLPSTGPTLRSAFEALVTTLNARNIRYAIIGGMALLQHTRVRTTNDIDALLIVPQIGMPGLFDALRDRGFSVDVPKNVHELRGGLTTIRFASVLVDLMQPVLPAFAHVLDRAIDAQVFGQPVRISSAEGLIVMKLVAMRPRDEADIQDLLRTYPGQLNLDYIRAEVETFMDASDPRRIKFEEWVLRMSGSK